MSIGRKKKCFKTSGVQTQSRYPPAAAEKLYEIIHAKNSLESCDMGTGVLVLELFFDVRAV